MKTIWGNVETRPTLRIMIRSCPRCGKDHAKIEVQEFTRPSLPSTHWTMCPTVGEPILVEMREVEAKPVEVAK